MACPFFMPVRTLNGPWPHPLRLPLGSGWQGLCTAPGHQGEVPAPGQLHSGCNLGYPADCPWLPHRRPWDAVRFSVASHCELHVVLWYVCEIAHRPGEHGQLECNLEGNEWPRAHPDPRIQKMAECFLESYLHKSQIRSAPAVRDVAHG